MALDPITQALLTGAAEGAAGTVTDAVLQGLRRAYKALKDAITGKHGEDSAVVTAIQELEKKPDSKGRQATLAEEVAEAKLPQDEALVTLAQALMDAQQAALQHYGAVIRKSKSTEGGALAEDQTGKGALIDEVEVKGDLIASSAPPPTTDPKA